MPKKRRKKKYEPALGFHPIVIHKKDDATPDPCTVYLGDWVCWINPLSTGKNFTITFTDKSPLKGAPADIKVKMGETTKWYQRKGKEKKGEKFEYHCVPDKGAVAPPGPVIIAGDG